ncbi:hypothetical protein BJ170DRAFT_694432 [Xylariales sp. AK1849]|nr:hypothetical protein BJ170DRAFT_694432 [Xylariales sp. AK1849]
MPYVPHTLSELMYQGRMGGFRWTTQPYWDTEKETWVKRALLISHSTRRMVKALVKSTHCESGLPDLKKHTVSQGFGTIYDYAAENVDQCRNMPPKQFFAIVKNNFHFADTIDDDTFWEFTYKAFHARNLFRDQQAGWRYSKGHALVWALDKFNDKFYEDYNPKFGNRYLMLPEGLQDQEEMAKIKQRREENLRVGAQYFPPELTDADHQGDGKDRLIVFGNTFNEYSAGSSDPESKLMNADGTANGYYQGLHEDDVDDDQMDGDKMDVKDDTEPTEENLRVEWLENQMKNLGFCQG